MNAVAPQANIVRTSLAAPIDLESAIVNCSETADLVVLDSANVGGQEGRYSILACDPVQVLTHDASTAPDPISALVDRVRSTQRIQIVDGDGSFLGGWIGYIGYEAGHALERVQSNNSQVGLIPQVRFGLYDTMIRFDHEAGGCEAVAVDWPTGMYEDRPRAMDRIDRLTYRMLTPVARHTPTENLPENAAMALPDPSQSYDQYRDAVQAAKRYIESGDIYQVNLTQRFSRMCTDNPLDLYLRLRRFNPGAYSAYIRWPACAILSSSPELFLRLKNGAVQTRPIKGTQPRVNDAGLPTEPEQLAASEKDLAELNMIVDLLRNDLGRVCAYGSIRVVDPGSVEQHPTVYHRVATIEGRLSPEKDWADLLCAAFPGGSITGAPKIRAMQIIEELEPVSRDVYCGAIGWIGLDGAMCLNIAIRTMLHVQDRVHVYAGGAIVADSVMEDEYQELLAKSKGMFQALGWRQPELHRVPMGAAVS